MNRKVLIATERKTEIEMEEISRNKSKEKKWWDDNGKQISIRGTKHRVNNNVRAIKSSLQFWSLNYCEQPK